MIPKRFYKPIILSIIAFAVYFILPESMPEAARRVFCIFVLAALFWALEAIPLFATSLLVVLLEVFFLSRPGGVLDFGPNGYKVFLMPFGSPVIILFFGGFILASALHKYHIDRYIATHLLKLFGQKPYPLMVGFMFITALLSMWMSNTATTAMMIAMVLPLLKQLDKTEPFRKALVLSIPFAANIGGLGTPIGTPPNAIAIGILSDYNIHLDFFSWMKMAVPLAALLLLVASALLYLFFRPNQKRFALHVKVERAFDRRTRITAWIAGFTILFWLTSGVHKVPAAVIALTAAGLYLMSGLLDRDDVKAIDWDVLVLMWGGLALGKGMEISGLTEWIVNLPLLSQQGFTLIAVFCFLAVILSTFMSNTATANLIIPIVMALSGASQILLATTVALSCSVAMALPISTPPNAIAFATNMIQAKDMVKVGALLSLLSIIVILLGFNFFISKAFGL